MLKALCVRRHLEGTARETQREYLSVKVDASPKAFLLCPKAM
jgi:hypothetical protein